MKVSKALKNRKSVRAFTDKKVTKKILKKILKLAGNAPSGVNTQPWQVVVLTGDKKTQLQQKILQAFGSGKKANMDYQYYPLEWNEPYKARRRECGLQMYSALKISREEKEKQINQWKANYRAFDAPVMLLFFIDKQLQAGSYLDYGLFLQSLMLAATEQGLATCPQAALAEYPDITREFLGMTEDKLLLCGMALGYEDETAVVNSYRTSREKLSQWVEFPKEDTNN